MCSLVVVVLNWSIKDNDSFMCAAETGEGKVDCSFLDTASNLAFVVVVVRSLVVSSSNSMQQYIVVGVGSRSIVQHRARYGKSPASNSLFLRGIFHGGTHGGEKTMCST